MSLLGLAAHLISPCAQCPPVIESSWLQTLDTCAVQQRVSSDAGRDPDDGGHMGSPKGIAGACSRREFLGAAASAAAITVLPRHVLGGKGHVAPGDKITAACIGVGAQGTRVMMDLLKEADVQIVAVCDVNRESSDYVEWAPNELRDKERELVASAGWGQDWKGPTAGREPARRLVETYYAGKTTSGVYKGCAAYVDYRELLDQQKDLDAVIVGTPDHARATILTVGQKNLPSWMRSWTTWLGLALLTCAAALVFLSNTEEAIDLFWSPLWSSPGEFLICVGNLEGGRQADGGAGTIAPVTLRDFHQAASEVIHVNDAITLSRISALVQSKFKPYRIASQTEVTFADLQNGPSVLIGLMNNDWTERLVQNLRYTVERPTQDVILIRDHDNPSRNDWSVNYSTPYLNINKDFALVLRVSDPKTDQMTVTVAGISAFGTLAAGEFLTNPNEIRKIEAVAPKGWKKKNLELVLSVDVIRGKPGHADIVGAHFW